MTNPACNDAKFWRSYENWYYKGGADRSWGRTDLYLWCEYDDWKCWDKWGKNNPDKFPCPPPTLIKQCWIAYDDTQPPCRAHDGDCWDSYMTHYYPPEPEEPKLPGPEEFGKFDLYGYCEPQDWKCWDNWSENNPEKLPCEVG